MQCNVLQNITINRNTYTCIDTNTIKCNATLNNKNIYITIAQKIQFKAIQYGTVLCSAIKTIQWHTHMTQSNIITCMIQYNKNHTTHKGVL